MKLKINNSIDIKNLISELNLTTTRTKNLKSKIYYLLSVITDTNDNYKLNKSKDGYHKICSDIMKKILGNKDFYFIRKLLINPIDPIIEINGTWYRSTNKKKCGICQGYRITQKYNTGEVKFKSIPDKIVSKIQKYIPIHTLNKGINNHYEFLLSQFKQNKFSIDTKVFQYIKNFGNSLLKKTDNNEFQRILIYNLIGRWLYLINQIETDNIWKNVSAKNYRLNSSFTNLPKQLRPFLLCNGETLNCVDVSSSQPYLLSSVMQKRFYFETENGYNLKTIYPELYTELVDNGHIDISYSYSKNDYIKYYTSHTGTTYNSTTTTTTSTSYNLNTGILSFMWCEFLSQKELESLTNYTQSPFHLDFYSYIIKEYNQELETNDAIRDKLKGTMMYVLFDDNSNHRNHNEYIKIFQTVFPGVDNWIKIIHNIIGKRKFSYLLQRTESYIILGVICREFNQLYPNAPLFTIHDGIFTTDKYSNHLNRFVLSRLQEITGVVSGCKTKKYETSSEPEEKDIESKWMKIKSINNKKKFDKKSRGVFISNVDRGYEFLNNNLQ